MFYFHSKGVSRDPFCSSQVWRKNLDFYTISKWRISLELLKKYDAVGCFLTRWPMHHFSGNFWWARISYITNLPDCKDHYLGPEMWMGENFNNNFVSVTNRVKISADIHLTRTDEDIYKNITCSVVDNKHFKKGPLYKKHYSK